MFTELMPLLRKRRLLLTVSLVEGYVIRVPVVPQKATAEELDREFPGQFAEFASAHLEPHRARWQRLKWRWAKAAREEAKKETKAASSTPFGGRYRLGVC